MHMRTLIKVVTQLSIATALAGLAQQAAAAECPGFPRFGAAGTGIPTSGCGVTAFHNSQNPAEAANRRVQAFLRFNTSGALRRVMTVGLRPGGVPISAGCVASTTVQGGSAISTVGACSFAPMVQIRMHIQVP
jgi:hypothetical protein